METTALGYEWKGLPALEPHLIDIASVQKHPRNVRKGNVDALARMLQKYGQMSPIVVQASTGNICKGNHTWEAAKKIGWTVIAATKADLDDDTAFAYLLADNRASDLAEYDKAALARSLQELADAGKLQGTLWTADDVDDIQAAVGTLETLAQEFKGDYSDDPDERQKRLQRELTRIAPKMREVPIVVTVEQHRVLMEDIALLKKAWHTEGAIETIILAVRKAADGYTKEVMPIEEQPAESAETAAVEPSRFDGPQQPETPQPDQPAPLAVVSPLRAPQPLQGPEEAPPAQAQTAEYAKAEFAELLIAKLEDDYEPTHLIQKPVLFGLIETIAPMLRPGQIASPEVVALRKAAIDFRAKVMSRTGATAFTINDLAKMLEE